MKNLIFVLSLLLFAGTSHSQITDLPVSPGTSTICAGESTDITLTGSELDVKYSLRNSANAIIAGPIVGTGNDIVFNTGPLTSSETFNVYAEPNFHSAEFNGIDTYAQMTANNRGVGSAGMTIGVWIKTSLTGVRSYVASKYAGNVGYLFYVDINGKMRFDGRTGPTIYNTSGPSSTTVNDGQWHFVVGTTNGQCWNVFVDGVLESSQCNGYLGSVSTNNTQQLRLGMHNFQNYFDGEMDDFFLLNTPAAPATITSYYTTCLNGSEPNCTALFNFDEASATIIDDSPVAVNGFLTGSTYVNQGATACAPGYGPIQMSQTATVNVVTLSDFAVSGPASSCPGNSVTISTSGSVTGANYFLLDDSGASVDGPVAGTGGALSFNSGVISNPTTFSVISALSSSPPQNSSLQLDGIDEFVDFGSDQRTIGNNFSAGVWVKTTSTATSSFLLTKYDVGFVSGFVILMNAAGNVKIDGKAYTGAYLSSDYSSSSINDGQWHYIVGTGEIGGNFKIYVDGVLESTGATTISGVTLASTGNLQIGNFNGNFANAEFDQVELWNSTLTDSEILANMNGCLDANNPNLVAYYLLNEATGNTTSDASSFNITGTLQNMESASDWLNGVPGGCPSISGCNLTLTQEVTVSVGNNAPVPDVATLPDITGECEITSLTSPSATDDCSGSVIATNNASLPISSNTTITWTYDDGDGNTSSQTQNVVLNDVTAPVADLGSLPDLTAQCEITSLTPPTATDNCLGTVAGTHNATLPISSNTTITWSYVDGEGNTSTQTQNVVINDLTAPVADLGSLPTITDECSVTTLTAPTATDNCAGAIIATHNATLPITANATITWTYDDGNGNTTTQNQNVVIDDVTAPVPSLATLPDVLGQCSVTSLTNPSATDNCSAVTVTNDAVLPITANTTITWTYTDVEGNQSTQTQNVVINDNTAPVEDVATLTDLTAQCEITSLSPPNATDNCDGSIIGTHNVSLPITASTTIVWTYTDGSGNSTTQNQNVVINDNTAPVPDAPTLVDLTAQCEITALTEPTASDNCANTVLVTNNATLPISASTVIIWTYDDGNGNTVTQNQNVVIDDQTNPVPDIAQLATINEQCEITNLIAPTATDNCAGILTGTSSVSFPISTSTLITWTFTDNSGNTTTQDQQINIDDTVDPQPDLASLNDITETCEVTSLTAPTATDNCSGTITATSNATFPITSSTIVTWTYDDGNGNSITQDQNVVINAVDANTTTNAFTITANEANADGYQWVDCNNGNAPILGETGSSFTAAVNGSYAVEVTIGNCTETSPCETFTTIGISEGSMNDLVLYPNPTNEMLYVQSESAIQELRVIDITGALVKFVNADSMDVSALATGSYILEIKTTNTTYRKSFVVTH
ncbi:MAG: hypothetical protein Crog4KO_28300 [Crocinitomicaceae bacterium]